MAALLYAATKFALVHEKLQKNPKFGRFDSTLLPSSATRCSIRTLYAHALTFQMSSRRLKVIGFKKSFVDYDGMQRKHFAVLLLPFIRLCRWCRIQEFLCWVGQYVLQEEKQRVVDSVKEWGRWGEVDNRSSSGFVFLPFPLLCVCEFYFYATIWCGINCVLA